MLLSVTNLETIHKWINAYSNKSADKSLMNSSNSENLEGCWRFNKIIIKLFSQFIGISRNNRYLLLAGRMYFSSICVSACK